MRRLREYHLPLITSVADTHEPRQVSSLLGGIQVLGNRVKIQVMMRRLG